MRTIRADAARRIALASQGFADPLPRGRVDRRHLRRVLGRTHLLQLDSVNVCVRSHYMPLFSRLGPYRQRLIDEYAYDDGAMFEYWGHEASLIPMEMFPLFRHRMEEWKPGRWYSELETDDPGFVERIFREVEARGPISVGELDDGGERTGPWWGYGKGKKALEWLFAAGRIGCAYRNNFTRHYDVMERLIPRDLLDQPVIPRAEAQRSLLLRAAEAHGVGTATDLADYFRIRMPEARPVLEELVADGLLETVTVEGWDRPAYLWPDAKRPRSIDGAALLTPFDPIVWERSRTERLFGFHYRIEIYVPEPKRQYGYYVYPFLLGDELVARVDLKADRARGVLMAKGLYLEDGQDPQRVARALADQLSTMAAWLGMDDVEVGRRGNLAGSVKKALRA